MQNRDVINNREKVNTNISRLSRLGNAKGKIWTSKRRYGNL